MTQSIVLDESALLALLGGDGETLRELVRVFAQDGPRRLAQMRAALDASDLVALRKAAHTLKGSAGSLCGRSTVQAALRLEETAREGDALKAREQYAAVEAEAGKLQKALADLAERKR